MRQQRKCLYDRAGTGLVYALLLLGCDGEKPVDSAGTVATTQATTADMTTSTSGEPTIAPQTETGEPNGSETAGGCGNGQIDPGEACDDANTNNFDQCTIQCRFPSCTDGLWSGDETDIDCGGGCKACVEGASCEQGSDCVSQVCLQQTCVNAFSCREILEAMPFAEDGVYTINPDGPGGVVPFDVYCDMTHDGGGWTLLLVSSDDGQDTWTYENRELLTTNEQLVGALSQREQDFKSPAYHTLPFRDALFVHTPSGVWASYADVGSGTNDFGAFVATKAERICDFSLPGDGVPLSAGSLAAGPRLCDTNLYFNRGDHEGDLATCEDEMHPQNNATFGPVWNSANNGGCPFDDPAGASLGPRFPCPECGDTAATSEAPGRGYGGLLELNTGVEGTGENSIALYVR